eukprot:1130851-Amorphochlora_amoeboformis.AAC.1
MIRTNEKISIWNHSYEDHSNSRRLLKIVGDHLVLPGTPGTNQYYRVLPIVPGLQATTRQGLTSCHVTLRNHYRRFDRSSRNLDNLLEVIHSYWSKIQTNKLIQGPV